MISPSNMHHLFAAEIFNNCFPVANFLLKNYRQMGLDDVQFIVILHLLADKNSKTLDQYSEELNQQMTCSQDTINKALANLIERKILTIDGELQLEVLLAALEKTWQQQQQSMEAAVDDEAASLYTIFEQEFGRLLSPMEGEQILEWLERDKYDYHLIKGALKRAVLRGVLNFKYIDSILREWRKKNYKTINEVIRSENSRDAKNLDQPKPAVKHNKTNKYRDIYMG